MEKLLALRAVEGVSEDSGEHFIRDGGGAGAFEQVEFAAGKTKLVLETTDDSGEKAVHGPQREPGQGARHGFQSCLEIRIRQTET